jgi:hypothetical protein
VAGQHSNALEPAFHYTSPRFRKDAKVDAAALVNTFQSVTAALTKAKREAALEITSAKLICAWLCLGKNVLELCLTSHCKALQSTAKHNLYFKINNNKNVKLIVSARPRKTTQDPLNGKPAFSQIN